jgi:hypothetical protein
MNVSRVAQLDCTETEATTRVNEHDEPVNLVVVVDRSDVRVCR